MQRREAMVGLMGSAAALGGCASGFMPAVQPAFEAMDDVGRRKGLRVGSAIGDSEPGSTQQFGFGNPLQRALLARECGVMVCENEMKWQALRPSADRYDWRRADMMLKWAADNSLLVRGHTLLWMDRTFFPDWLNRYVFSSNAAQARTQAEALLGEHVRTVAGRYNAQVESWDVVNEAIAPETGEFRSNVFSQHLGGIETLELAFRQARAAAPNAQLVYNDFMGWGPSSAKHRAGVLKLLAELKKRGVPVNALGLQGHVGTAGDGSPMDPGGGDEREWRRFLEEASGMGLDLLITEFDINDRYLSNDVAQRDAQVAAVGKLFLDITLSFNNLHTLMFWGLTDPMSWLQNRWPRTDGAAKRPLPFDDKLQAKPLREAVVQALRAMPERQARRTA